MAAKKCPCCGYFTIEDDYDICAVCYWEYDTVAHNMSNVVIGPNGVSLNQTQKNYNTVVLQKRILLIRLESIK